MNKGIPKVIIIAYLIILTALIIPPTKGNFNLENSTTGSKIPETQGVTEIIWAETIFLNNIFTVSSDEKLIINAGVTIIMGENGGLRIYGNLSSNGREGLPVTITKEVSIMNWSGRIEFEGSYSELTYTIFENGYADKYNPLIHIVESTVVFQNCIFRNNNAYYGIITIREHSYMLLENSEFYQNYNNIYDERTDTSMGIIDLSWGYGIEEGSDMMIRQNVFHSNSHYYALGEFYDFTTKGIYFYNNIVVNQKGGIYGNLPTHDYNLYYSLTDSPLLGDHDIVAQPIFLDEGNYDFRLDPSSPGYTQGLDGEKMGIEGKLNFAPFVPALINQTGINENTEVKLRASGVFDLDFDSINFIWYQINGPNALIEEYDEIVKITVTSIGLYTFGLDVIDSKLKQTTQVFTINVDNGSPHKIRKIYSDSSNDNSITFKWQNVQQGDIIGYEIFKSIGSENNFDKIDFVETNSPLINELSTFEDYIVFDNIQYYYKIRAIDNMGYIGEFSNPIPLSINNKIISYYAHDDPILSDNIWNQTLWDQSYHRNLTSLFSDNFYFDLYMRHNDFSIYFTIVMKEVRLTQIYLSSDDYYVDAEASAPFNDLVLEITQTGVETQFSTTGFWQDLQPTFQQPEQEIIYQSDFSVFEFSLPYSYFKDVTLDSGSDILNFGFYWFGNNYWFGNQITGGGYGSAEGIINLNVGDNDTQGAFQIISHPSNEIDKYYNPYISWEIQPEIYIYQINLNDRYEFFGKILNSILNIDLTSVEDGIYNLTLTVTTKNGNSSIVDYVINVFSSPSTAVSTTSDILPSTTSYSTLSSDKTDSNINEEGPELPINLPYPNSVFVTLIFISVMSIIQKRKN